MGLEYVRASTDKLKIVKISSVRLVQNGTVQKLKEAQVLAGLGARTGVYYQVKDS